MFSIAIFFNADHRDLSNYYGPPCTKKVVQFLQKLNVPLSTRVLIGDLISHTLVYDIGSISQKGSSRSINYKPNYERYKTLIFDLVDSLKNNFYTINEIDFILKLSQNNIWTVLLANTNKEISTKLNDHLKSFTPYLGLAQVDTGNPIQMHLFNLLRDESYIKNSEIYFLSNEAIELDENIRIAETYGSVSKPHIIKEEEFNDKAPPTLSSTETSIRGKLSLERYKGKSKITHKERVANALLEYLETEMDPNPIYFNADLDEDKEEFICEKNKIKNYLLNLNHQDGKPKAKFFEEELGIDRKDWRYLSDQIIQSMEDAMIFEVQMKYGIRHEAFSMITGKNGKSAVLRSVWEIKDGQGARLITAFPGERKHIDKFSIKTGSVVPSTLKGDKKWSAIYKRAHKAGKIAAKSIVPTPLKVQGFSTTFAGLCGFAWVIVPDARTGFARWLRKNEIGYPEAPSGQRVYSNIEEKDLNYGDSQSIEPKEAYVKEFAKVLKANGIECSYGSKLD